MHIGWSFLDKHRAAIEAIEARNSMKYILEHTPDDIQAVRARMSSASAPVYSSTPHTHNPKAGEDRMLAGIDKINILQDRYNQAMEYFDWFDPAWEQLSDDDKYVLEMFFVDNSADTVDEIAEHFCIERSSVYSKRRRAIDRLATLLYGK